MKTIQQHLEKSIDLLFETSDYRNKWKLQAFITTLSDCLSNEITQLLSLNEVIEILMYQPPGMNRTICTAIANHGNMDKLLRLLVSLVNDDADIDKLFRLLESLPQLHNLNPNDVTIIASLLYSISTRISSKNIPQYLTFLQKLPTSVVNTTLITLQLKIFYTHCIKYFHEDVATFYHLANCQLLPDTCRIDLVNYKEKILEQILLLPDDAEKKVALGRCLIKDTPLGKIFWTKRGENEPDIRNFFGTLRKIFMYYFEIDPYFLDDNEVKTYLDKVSEDNTAVTITTGSSSSSSCSSSTSNNANDIPRALSAPATASSSSDSSSNSSNIPLNAHADVTSAIKTHLATIRQSIAASSLSSSSSSSSSKNSTNILAELDQTKKATAPTPSAPPMEQIDNPPPSAPPLKAHELIDDDSGNDTHPPSTSSSLPRTNKNMSVDAANSSSKKLSNYSDNNQSSVPVNGETMHEQYSDLMQEYLLRFIGNPDNSNSNQFKRLGITPKKEWCDSCRPESENDDEDLPGPEEVMDIPVRLHTNPKNRFNLTTLINLPRQDDHKRLHPHTRRRFKLIEILPAEDIQREIDEVIKAAELNQAKKITAPTPSALPIEPINNTVPPAPQLNEHESIDDDGYVAEGINLVDDELPSYHLTIASYSPRSLSTSTSSMLDTFSSQPTENASSNSSCIGTTIQSLATATNVVTTAPASSLSNYQLLANAPPPPEEADNYPVVPEGELEKEQEPIAELV